MMNSIRNPQILAAALAGALLSATQAPAAPAQDRPPATLELAQRTFKKLDANQDGAISLTEARRGGLTVSSFNGQDADANQRLSEEEFTLLYRGLLSSRGYPIATDLDRAVQDIQDARKKAAEAQRVQEARKKQADLDAKRTQEARQKQAQQSAEARTAAARKQQADLDAKRIQEARQKQAQQSAEARTAEARKKQADLDAQRAQDARKKQASGGDGTDRPKPTQVPTKPKKVKKARKPTDAATPPAADSKGRPGGSDGGSDGARP